MKEPNQDSVFYRNLRKFYPTVDRGGGGYIYDTKGKECIDGSGGAAVVGIGHGVKEITEAILRQAEKISFSHGSQFTSQAAIDLASRLVELSPKGLIPSPHHRGEGKGGGEGKVWKKDPSKLWTRFSEMRARAKWPRGCGSKTCFPLLRSWTG
ncbi:MAG: aminotransferase class III-fold pyridoxal phosphate-dependent enzyme [Thermodesulfobacteriota bacterium]